MESKSVSDQFKEFAKHTVCNTFPAGDFHVVADMLQEIEVCRDGIDSDADLAELDEIEKDAGLLDSDTLLSEFVTVPADKQCLQPDIAREAITEQRTRDAEAE